MKTNTINKKDIAKLFKWKHFLPEIILLCIRWYLEYKLSFRNMVEMMALKRIKHGTYDNHEMGS